MTHFLLRMGDHLHFHPFALPFRRRRITPVEVTGVGVSAFRERPGWLARLRQDRPNPGLDEELWDNPWLSLP